MGTPSGHSVLLKAKEARQKRKELLLFFDLLGLYVSAGYDLSYAWSEAIQSTGLFLTKESNQSINSFLKYLENHFVPQEYRFTFKVLRQLYQRGATLSPAIQAFSRTLRRDLERDIEGHLRTAPTRANICLLLFFLPPALALVVFPFLQQLRQIIFHP